jgi:hypothetical protein
MGGFGVGAARVSHGSRAEYEPVDVGVRALHRAHRVRYRFRHEGGRGVRAIDGAAPRGRRRARAQTDAHSPRARRAESSPPRTWPSATTASSFPKRALRDRAKAIEPDAALPDLQAPHALLVQAWTDRAAAYLAILQAYGRRPRRVRCGREEEPRRESDEEQYFDDVEKVLAAHGATLR